MSNKIQINCFLILTYCVILVFGTGYSDSNPTQQFQGYKYEYNVRDTHYGTNFGHMEERTKGSGDGSVTTRGTYYVWQPDGRMRIVNYWADKSGYHADVRYEPMNPPAPVQDHKGANRGNNGRKEQELQHQVSTKTNSYSNSRKRNVDNNNNNRGSYSRVEQTINGRSYNTFVQYY